MLVGRQQGARRCKQGARRVPAGHQQDPSRVPAECQCATGVARCPKGASSEPARCQRQQAASMVQQGASRVPARCEAPLVTWPRLHRKGCTAEMHSMHCNGYTAKIASDTVRGPRAGIIRNLHTLQQHTQTHSRSDDAFLRAQPNPPRCMTPASACT